MQQYNLEERTYKLAVDSKEYVKKLPRNQVNTEYGKQLIRSSGSVAANYIEANEALSKKDFYMRIKICRKEVKESRLWFRLTEPFKEEELNKKHLIEESTELLKIFS